MKSKIFVLMMLSLILKTGPAVAGTEGGGGGDAVTLPNGEVVLADAFLDRNQPQPNNMPRRMSLNPMLIVRLKVYGEFLKTQLGRSGLFDDLHDIVKQEYCYSSYSFGTICSERPLQTKVKKNSEILKLIEELGIRENSLVFYSVHDQKELNAFCASGGVKPYILPTGATVNQVACTSGNEIFIVEPLFRRMNVLQQSLLLMHERMTTLRDEFGGKNYAAIAGVTSGLGEIIRQAYNQQQGNYNKLSTAEITRIHHFYEGAIELEFRNSEIPTTILNWKIHPNGGGLISTDSEIEGSAFISVTSFLKGIVRIGKDSQILDSTISGDVSLGASNIIKKSSISGTTLTTGTNFTMLNSQIETSDKVVKVNDNQRMENGLMNDSLFDYIPEGYELEHIKFVSPQILTKCQLPLKKMKRTNSPFECFSDFGDIFRNLGVHSDKNELLFNLKQTVEANGKKVALRSYQFTLETFKIKSAPDATYANYQGDIGPAVDKRERYIKISNSGFNSDGNQVARPWGLATKTMLIQELTTKGFDTRDIESAVGIKLKVNKLK